MRDEYVSDDAQGTMGEHFVESMAERKSPKRKSIDRLGQFKCSDCALRFDLHITIVNVITDRLRYMDMDMNDMNVSASEISCSLIGGISGRHKTF